MGIKIRYPTYCNYFRRFWCICLALECIACGHTWYTPRDAISSLTIDTPNIVGNAGTAPWATAEFEDVEKKLVSPEKQRSLLLTSFTSQLRLICLFWKPKNRSTDQRQKILLTYMQQIVNSLSMVFFF
uniref:Uncharacterized protein n=1 Tax=Ananas comosus var. bracteatus TaxID=296719 RepID=A0A6V7PSF0_ANACO|nr:unnamed protein product [Ananas comosus var. bracteatus]